MKNRIEALDSIRGLAALSVFLGHMALTLPFMPLLLRLPPFKMLINGNGAVIIFFILSGFVLSLAFLKKRNVSYKTFILKRIVRIYPPYIASIVVAITLVILLSNSGLKGYSLWLDKIWNEEVSFTNIMDHILLVGNYYTGTFNAVVWSLVHEMRISFVFPIIAILIIRFNWKVNLIVCVVLSSFSVLNDIFNWNPSNGYYVSYFDSLHYASMFIVGALLAKNRVDIVGFYKNLSLKVKWLILFVAFFTYNYSNAASKVANSLGLPIGNVLSDYIVTLGACLFIISALGSVRISNLLAIKPILFLGKVSYSLYLYHLLVLFTLISLLGGIISMWIIYLLAIVIGLLVSYLTWWLFENPAIKMSQYISRREKKTSTQLSAQTKGLG